MKGFSPDPKPKRNKFGAKKQTYNGYNYDSIKEAEYAEGLDWRIKAKEVKSWTRQHKFELRVEGVLIAKYYIDFRVVLTNGQIEYHECKGFPTDLWKLKWKMTEALFDKLTEGETAHLVLNNKRVLSSHNIK